MRKDFFEPVQYAWSLGFEQNLLTNGLLFSENNIDSLKKYFFRIQVSINFCVNSDIPLSAKSIDFGIWSVSKW